MLKPQESRYRDLRSLDGLWTFALDTEVDQRPWLSRLPVCRQVPVPASYNDIFMQENLREHVGVVWYQRDVRVPYGWLGQRIVIRFDAATHAGMVYLDDRLVVEHRGGFTPFEADITELVVPGETVRLTVGVDNRLTPTTIPPGEISIGPDGEERQTYRHDFFNYAGLPRSVFLYTTPTHSLGTQPSRQT